MDGAWVGLQQEGHVQHDVRLEQGERDPFLDVLLAHGMVHNEERSRGRAAEKTFHELGVPVEVGRGAG